MGTEYTIEYDAGNDIVYITMQSSLKQMVIELPFGDLMELLKQLTIAAKTIHAKRQKHIDTDIP